MKKSISLYLVVFLMSSFCVNFLDAQVNYASNNYTTSNSFNSQVDVVLSELKKSGYTLVDYDITTLSRYQDFPWDLTCYSGREYVVFGYTEEGVKDLGLYIYDSKGKYVTANAATKNNGITFTKFNANINTNARIVAKNENSVSALKNYKVAIIVPYRYK